MRNSRQFWNKFNSDYQMHTINNKTLNLRKFSNNLIKLRREMGNMSQRQQPDQSADNTDMGLQCSKKYLFRETYFIWHRNKNVYCSVIMDFRLNSEIYKRKKKDKNHTRLKYHLFIIWISDFLCFIDLWLLNILNSG